MAAEVKKWGNSLAFRIPKDIARTLGIQDNTKVELQVRDGKLIVKPQKELLLEEMVSRISSENLHEEIDSCYDEVKSTIS
jgi:antitoxin MazE